MAWNIDSNLVRSRPPMPARAGAWPSTKPVGTDFAVTAALWLTYAAALYPFVLCFLNTRVATMPNAAIIISEMLIAAAALPILAVRMNLGILLLSLCICINYFFLAVFEQGNDFKALRDLLVPVVFVWLGYIVGSRRLAERVLRNLAIVAVVVGSIEWIFPGLYASFFDSIGFYASRGFGANNPFALTVLQVRPAGIGRSLLPFLGPRRISSIFLEPVALGNFGVLIAAWALSKPRTELRETIRLMVCATVLIVMADARFGSITVLVLCAIRATHLWKVRLLSALMPVAGMLLMVLTVWYGPHEIHDNIVGRFQISGRNLIDMSWSAWLGIPGSISMDAGYGYIIQRTGIVICAALWFLFALLPLKDDQARRFHFNAALYMSLLLCISGSSLFSLKTTAILWLLLGTVIAHHSFVDRFRIGSRMGTGRMKPGHPIARRSIGGFDILALDTDQLVTLLHDRRDAGEATELMFANTNFVMSCRPLTQALGAAETVIVNDGIGVDLASLLFHRRFFPENLNGTDFVPRLLGTLDRPTRLFLLGAQPASVQSTARLWGTQPNIEIVGAVDGFGGMSDADALSQKIRATSPDILLVALGDPRQARWIVENRGRHRVPLVIAVGALFDFVSATVPRAPRVFRRLRLEWAYRLAHEPRRLLKRYSVDLVVFFAHCFAAERRRQSPDASGSRVGPG